MSEITLIQRQMSKSMLSKRLVKTSIHKTFFDLFFPDRTVKKEGDVLETDHQEQTYTISGAADESEDE